MIDIKDTSKYDAVLVCNYDNIISEATGDERSYTRTNAAVGKHDSSYTYFWYDNPKLYAQNAFGRNVQAELNSWKPGFSAKVSDFSKWVVVEVTHHNYITGRSASKTFLIVFDGGPKGNDPAGGMVLTTASKWRTISGTSQAVSYIKSASSALESETSKKL